CLFVARVRVHVPKCLGKGACLAWPTVTSASRSGNRGLILVGDYVSRSHPRNVLLERDFPEVRHQSRTPTKLLAGQLSPANTLLTNTPRSEERRVGKECRPRWTGQQPRAERMTRK